MIGVILEDILDPKVVNDDGESNGIGGVLPESRSYGDRSESKMGKMSFEPVVGDAAGLFGDGYAFLDLKVNPAVGTKCA